MNTIRLIATVSLIVFLTIAAVAMVKGDWQKGLAAAEVAGELAKHLKPTAQQRPSGP